MIEGQLNIYNIIGLTDDHVYNQICNLKIDEELFLDKIIIRRTAKFFEIESDEVHECFKGKDACYQFFSQITQSNCL